MAQEISAQEAVGVSNPEVDWNPDPAEQINLLADKEASGALVRSLEDEAVNEQFLEYKEYDKSALKWQAKDAKFTKIKITAILMVTIIGAAYLLPIPFVGDSSSSFSYKTVRGCLGEYPVALAILKVVVIMGIIIQFFAAQWSDLRNYHGKWVSNRAQAELKRFEIIDSVVNSKESVKSGELPLLPLQLEYFRRFLMKSQEHYFIGKQKEHFTELMGSKKRYWSLKGTKYIIVFIAAMLAVPTFLIITQKAGYLPLKSMNDYIQNFKYISPFSHYAEQALLGFGIIVSAYHSYMIMKNKENQHERNAREYAKMAYFLEGQLAEPLDQARKDVEAGKSERVHTYITNIKEVLNREHEEWKILRKLIEDDRNAHKMSFVPEESSSQS